MNLAFRLLERSKVMRRSILWTAQISMFVVSAVVAFLLRFDLSLPQQYLRFLLLSIPIWALVKMAVFRAAKIDQGLWRYVSLNDLIRVGTANTIASIVSCPLILLVSKPGFPRSIFIIDLLACLLATSGLRLAVRVILEASSSAKHSRPPAKRVLIYGAGNAGITLLREIRNNQMLPYRPLGFVDDRGDKKGIQISGLQVLGAGENIKSLVSKEQAEMILIAIPSASGAQMTRIMELCHVAGVQCRTVPGLGEVLQGRGLAGQIREVAVEDLLGRTPVILDESQIHGVIEGKVVIVTGAAGSIGSELCRQIARFRPGGIVGLDIAESPLFEIDREMRLTYPDIPFYPEIASIQNRLRLDEILSKHRPTVLYHAAAYKHVPLMEAHAFEAIENNVFGTYNVAMAAAEWGVQDFVMISTDKAVRPTNVMGATKRLSELILLALQNGRTKYVAVRFGNVLGSNGSVIPIFKKQIMAGGPVTVTHPEMRRYFMTIPEACQLVLQASAIGKGGQICVLDMGEPVKIVDLAKDLILLSGLRPNEDIKIDFSGIRPGEKLYEELSSTMEDTVSTEHDRIRIFVGVGAEDRSIQSWLQQLHAICERRDIGELVVALKEMVMDYSPSTHLLKRMVSQRRESSTVAHPEGSQPHSVRPLEPGTNGSMTGVA